MGDIEEKSEAQKLYEEAKKEIELLEVLIQPEDTVKQCKKIAALLDKAGDYEDAKELSGFYVKKAEEMHQNGLKQAYERAEKVVSNAKNVSDYDRGIGMLRELGDFSGADAKAEQYQKVKMAFIRKQNIMAVVELVILAVIVAAGFFYGNRWLNKEKEKKMQLTEKTVQNCEPGDQIEFGSYKWKVLSDEDGTILLLGSECDQYEALTDRCYHDQAVDVTWENCAIRSYLNGEFLEEGFSEEEREMIQPVMLTNGANSEYHTPGGSDTEDEVYLLSEDEVSQYWDMIKGMELNWLLRTPGNDAQAVMYVSSDHKIRTYGTAVTDEMILRPAIRVKVEN